MRDCLNVRAGPIVAGALVLASTLVAATSGTLYAAEGTIVVHRDQSSSGYSATAGGGGEFAALQYDGPATPSAPAGVVPPGSLFQSFCLERAAPIYFDTPLHWTMNLAASGGGLGGGGTDPISPETAYLFTQFWNHALSSYQYALGPGRQESALQLQIAIWALEEEIPPGSLYPDEQSYTWVQEAHAAVAAGGSWYAAHGANSIGDVRVLTLTDANGAALQDLLIRVVETRTGGGGHTPGFWGNKNGQKLIDAADLAALRDLNLVNANGTAFDPTTAKQVKEWLRNSTAVNMAYKLSVHLACMKLNVLNGFVDPAAVVHAPGCGDASLDPSGNYITIGNLITKANTELGLHSVTKSGSAFRAYQACLEAALDAANNNENFV
jgi:hypothetical protein